MINAKGNKLTLAILALLPYTSYAAPDAVADRTKSTVSRDAPDLSNPNKPCPTANDIKAEEAKLIEENKRITVRIEELRKLKESPDKALAKKPGEGLPEETKKMPLVELPEKKIPVVEIKKPEVEIVKQADEERTPELAKKPKVKREGIEQIAHRRQPRHLPLLADEVRNLEVKTLRLQRNLQAEEIQFEQVRAKPMPRAKVSIQNIENINLQISEDLRIEADTTGRLHKRIVKDKAEKQSRRRYVEPTQTQKIDAEINQLNALETRIQQNLGKIENIDSANLKIRRDVYSVLNELNTQPLLAFQREPRPLPKVDFSDRPGGREWGSFAGIPLAPTVSLDGGNLWFTNPDRSSATQIIAGQTTNLSAPTMPKGGMTFERLNVGTQLAFDNVIIEPQVQVFAVNPATFHGITRNLDDTTAHLGTYNFVFKSTIVAGAIEVSKKMSMRDYTVLPYVTAVAGHAKNSISSTVNRYEFFTPGGVAFHGAYPNIPIPKQQPGTIAGSASSNGFVWGVGAGARFVTLAGIQMGMGMQLFQFNKISNPFGLVFRPLAIGAVATVKYAPFIPSGKYFVPKAYPGHAPMNYGTPAHTAPGLPPQAPASKGAGSNLLNQLPQAAQQVAEQVKKEQAKKERAKRQAKRAEMRHWSKSHSTQAVKKQKARVHKSTH